MRENSNKISIIIDGDEITAAKFKQAFESFLKLVNNATNKVADEKITIDWIVSFEPGSLVTTLRCDPTSLNNIYAIKGIKILENGLPLLNNHACKPEGFDDEMLDDIKTIMSITNGKDPHKIENVKICTHNSNILLTKSILKNIDTIKETGYQDYGSIEGRLETISIHRSPRFTVYEVLTGRGINCNFKRESTKEIRNALGERVYVYGLIDFNSNGEPNSISVESFEVFPQKELLPTADEVYGILGD